MKWILAATDGSEAAQAAERHAASLALRLGEGLLLAYVVPQPMVPPEAVMPLGRIVEDHTAWARTYLQERSASLAQPGVRLITKVLSGPPAETLARLAQSDSIDLVVTGSRGRGALASLLLGSVAHRLSHICPKPLLIVRDPKEQIVLADKPDIPLFEP